MKSPKTCWLENKGFTLLELMLSITILAVMLTIVFGAFRIGARAWEKGEAAVEEHQHLRIVLGRITRQLAAATLPAVADPQEARAYFKGDARELAFVSQVPLIPRNERGLVYVRYGVRPGQDRTDELVFEEQSILIADQDNDRTPANETVLLLLTSLETVSFEYWGQGQRTETLSWRTSWDSLQDQGLPRAIKMVLKKSQAEDPITIITRIHQQQDQNQEAGGLEQLDLT